jgi:RNA polymerase sigma factor (sigma-70 family)
MTAGPDLPRPAPVNEPISLARRLSIGDQDALEECYRTLGPLVRSYLGRYVDRTEVDDLLQVTFLELWRSRDRLDPDRALEPFVLTIARRRAVDQLRRTRQVIDSSAVRELIGDQSDELLDRMAWAETVRQALDGLPETQRQVIELAYFSQLSQREISEHLGVALGTVKARTWRGLRALADRLEGRQW